MKTFKEFLNENEDWKHTEVRHNYHVFVNQKNSDSIHIRHGLLYSKEKNSRLRDPNKTKYLINIDHHSDSDINPLVNKSLSKAENQDFRDRKQKTTQSIIKKIQKSHGVDISKAFQ
jgi:hypothetical protein